MKETSDRWTTVTESEFSHEREGLSLIRDSLPDRAPYRAWSNFEMQDSRGGWHEVDLLVLGEGRLHLVELKHYNQVIRGNAYKWQVGSRTEDSPVINARRKAQRLASLLKDKARELGMAPHVVPFVQESVVLHAEHSRSQLTDISSIYGLDGRESSTGLPGIGQRLQEPPRRGPVDEAALLEVIDAAGFAVRREREVGSWRLIEKIGAGEATEEWLAEHKFTRAPARIQFHVAPPGQSAAARAAMRTLVEREFALTESLHHRGVLSPTDFVEDDLGLGLVFKGLSNEQPLDLWLADHEDTLSLSNRLALVRQLAEAVRYAHERGLAHRALDPRAVVVTETDNKPILKVGGWHHAGVLADSTSLPETKHAATRIFGLIESTDAEGVIGAYSAPEARWKADANRVLLDIFAVGCLAHLVLTGEAPAANSSELAERLEREEGLDLAAAFPQASEALRNFVRGATAPVIGKRTRDAAAFIESLAKAEREAATPSASRVDPLDAPPGTALSDRFVLVRRLGSGSTAAGLLVEDAEAGGEFRVLKVALDDSATSRLADEADTLASLSATKSPRLVKALEPAPVTVGSRSALLLDFAGDETLADTLQRRGALSLDLLVRWGTDLLEAMVALDAAGIDHRDIKPSNLGIREQPGDHAKHLVLFDFSLAKAPADQITAGTPPYLDPFLGRGTRLRWDTAAELYAASVTLFEMATGRHPSYGDGQTAPQFAGPLAIESTAFQSLGAPGLRDFYAKALDPDASRRYGTAMELQRAFAAVLQPATTQVPEHADDVAERAGLDTKLEASGLTARAISALAPLQVETIRELIGLDLVEINRVPGLVDATKREIRARIKQWRERLAGELEKPREPEAKPADSADLDVDHPLRTPRAVAQLLVERAGSARATVRRRAAATLLGLEGDIKAFAVGTAYARALDLGGPPQVSMTLKAVREAWEKDPLARGILAEIRESIETALGELAGVAWSGELARAISPNTAGDDARVVEGLVRAAIDVADDAVRTPFAAGGAFERRRAAGGPVAIASCRADHDAAAALNAALEVGKAAKRLVEREAAPEAAVVPAPRVESQLRSLWPSQLTPLEPARLARTAARFATGTGATSRGELFNTDMSAADALRIVLNGNAATKLSIAELRQLVRVRLPGVRDLPGRPGLDRLVEQADSGLMWVGDGYARPADPTVFTATATSLPPLNTEQIADSELDQALRDSAARRSFLAIGVTPQRVQEAANRLEEAYDAEPFDVTEALLDALAERAKELGVPWDAVIAADAEAEGTEGKRGLATLVDQAVPGILAAIDSAVKNPDIAAPVMLTEVAPLARYGHLRQLGRYTDVTAVRTRAVWLVLPEQTDMGPAIDGVSLPLNAPGQFIRLTGAVPSSQGVTA